MKILDMLFFLLPVLKALIHPLSATNIANICRADEGFQSCGTACPKTCHNFDQNIICTKRCVKGCFCKEDLVRANNGSCISSTSCHRKYRCRANEVFRSCGTACPATCDNYNQLTYCTVNCLSGCFCEEGFVRDRYNFCVPIESCKTGKECPRNEMMTQCSKPKWCNSCEIRGNCKLSSCRPGCDCQQGYLRNEFGACIPQTECKICNRPDEEFYYYKPDCQNKCETYPIRERILCPRKEQNSGCFCRRGLVLRQDGRCVPFEQCQLRNTCSRNEVYTRCEKPNWCNTCSIRGLCKLHDCLPGCDCQTGYFRDAKGICIPEFQCPGSCPDNEVFVHCAKPRTCNTCSQRGNCIMSRCIPGCDCKPGYYRDRFLNCILEQNCPNQSQQCPPNEEITNCPTPCSECRYQRAGCPIRVACSIGCDCKQGFARYNNVCIPTHQCPIKY